MYQRGILMREKIFRDAVQQAAVILKSNLVTYTEQFPAPNTENGFYPTTGNTDWTTGFCTGSYWLAWELTGDRNFKESAQIQVDSFLERIRKKADVDHHDMGFLYTPSCTASYMLTGNERAKEAAVRAADQLVSRFQEKGNFLQAWGRLGAKDNYRLIIDCLMNLPLLYWASEVTGDEIYRKIAQKHTETSMKHLVRDDFSTYHTYFFDPDTGKPVRGVTAQGYKNNSAWARGQAWGIYGMALAWRHTGNDICRTLFRQVTDFYLRHLPNDGIPYWDLCFSGDDGEPKDSSAAAIAVCGLLEMCENGGVSGAEAEFYKEKALWMLEQLIAQCAVRDLRESNGLLLHGVYAKSSPYNSVSDRGVDECNLWGDYFYLEALTRSLTDWKPYW